MKNGTVVVTLAILILGFGGYGLAYEGATKAVAVMTYPEKGETEFGPILLIPSEEMAPAKPVQQLLRRVPEPTLSIERIRTEKPGTTSGTKAVVLFQGERKER